MKCPKCQCEFEHPGWELDEVVAMAAGPTVGMRRADAEAFWAHYAAVGFVDAAGRQIVNLRAALLKWKAAQPSHGKKYAEERGGPVAPPSVYALETKKKILEQQMQPLKARFEHLSDAQRAEFKRLRAEVSALDEQILRAAR